MIAYSSCGRIACYGLRIPGQALRCPRCGNTQVVFHRAPEAERLIAQATAEIDRLIAVAQEA